MKSNDKIILKTEADCVGCGACIAACAHNAISKGAVGFGAWIPTIDADACIKCGLCKTVCDRENIQNVFEKKAYVAYNKDKAMRMKSSSGGVFSALATYILDIGGVVFGAEMRITDGRAIVEHVKITDIEELPRIVGSKYVQSDCIAAYKEIKKELRDGKVVLFSGCSCQVDGLKKYLGNQDMTNLFTLDLICHGVPGIDLLNDYIKYLGKEYGGELISLLSFRTKLNGKTKYEITATVKADGDIKEIKIPIRDSGYYRMFMTEESYRKACYSCKYASLDKPADITVGDYFEIKEDYPELLVGENAIDIDSGISCLISHTAKGGYLLKKAEEYIFKKEVNLQVVQASHKNLRKPSKYSALRPILMSRYKRKGYAVIDKYFNLRNRFADLVKRRK